MDWCVYNTHSQFIHFWWAGKEDYKIISEKLENERDEYIDSEKFKIGKYE